MFGRLINPDGQAKTFLKYEQLRSDCYRANLYYKHAFNHCLIRREKFRIPDGFNRVVPVIPFDDSCLLDIPEFHSFLEVYLDTKGKLISESNPKLYDDYIFTRCKTDIAIEEFRNLKIKNYALKLIMLDHFKAYGAYNSTALLNNFRYNCSDQKMVHEVDSLFATDLKNNNDHLIINYKKRQLIDLKAHVFAAAQRKGKPRPVVCCFFGGGWYEGSPEQFFECCRYFAENGFVAIAFEYSTKGRFNTTPGEGFRM